MPKDYKIGMTLGMALVIITTLWLASRPSLNPQVRLGMPYGTSSPAGGQGTPSILDENPVSSIQYRVIGAENNQLSIINNRPDQPDLTVYEQPQKIKTQKFHIVRKGETLSTISQRYYGSANKWQKIVNANRSQIANANRLAPGTKLIIPD